MTRAEIHKRVNSILLLLIAFFIPAYIHVVPALIVLLLLNWLIEGNFSEKFLTFYKNKKAWLPISLYLFYLTGMLWTKNFEYGWFDLQVKLSLLIFPLILCTNAITKRNTQNTLLSFVSGCVAGSILCIIHELFLWIISNSIIFSYTDFSFILHHGYFSMYLNFAIAIIVCGWLNKEDIYSKREIAFVALTVFFAAMIFLLSSKMGIVTLIIQTLIYAAQLIFRKKQRLAGIIAVLLIASATFLAFQKIERLSEIFYWVKQANQYKSYYKHEAESTMSRIFIWEASIDIIKENFLSGVGTGDAKDVLLEKYQKEDMTGAYEKKLNAHNQFFQTQIAIGILGSLILLMSLVIPFFNSLKTKTKTGNKIFVLFIVLIVINFLVESMLEVQAGVMFYAFFNSLLLFSEEKKV